MHKHRHRHTGTLVAALIVAGLLVCAAPAAHAGGDEHHMSTGTAWLFFFVQVLGFGALVYVLYKFAGPLFRKALDDRREAIAGDFDALERASREAEERMRELAEKLDRLDDASVTRQHKVLDEGRRLREGILADAEKQAQEILARVQAEIGREKDKATLALRLALVEDAVGAVRDAVAGRVDDGMQNRLVDDYLASLESRGDAAVLPPGA